MARPKNPKRRYKVGAMIEGYYYDYLTKLAEKRNTSLSETIRLAISFAVNNQYGGALKVSLDAEQAEQLKKLADKKNMSVDLLASRIIASYLEV